MYTIPPKKMVIINILDILKRYSDMDHRLTQAQIQEILKKEYYMDVDRRTVKRNLMNLLEFDFGIDYTERIKKDKNGEEIPICTDWYIIRKFDDSELRLLIDSVLFSRTIPQKQCRQLVKKLKGLSNVYFDKKVDHISSLPEHGPENKELFYTIDVLDEAISENRKVSFLYNSYGADKKLHPRREKRYVVNPYQMVTANGRHYLICNYDHYDNLSNYRIDHITEIQIVEEKRKPVSSLKEGKLDLPRHMVEHLYMFAGESAKVTFRAENLILDQVIDWFGVEPRITEETDTHCLVEVTVNQEAFFCWALQYGLYVEVLEPAALREKVIRAIETMREIYRNGSSGNEMRKTGEGERKTIGIEGEDNGGKRETYS